MAKNYTVKKAVNQALLEMGITQFEISQAVGSPDQDIAQSVALLSAVAEEVLSDEPYSSMLGDGNWLIDGLSGEQIDFPLHDEDIIMFDGRIAVQGLIWRFRKAKGLEFGEDLRDFTSRLNKLAGKANGRVIDLDTDYGRVA